MKVSELIELLERCPEDAIVMYDMENALKNTGFMEHHVGVDDVLIGMGTNKGFVYLAEDLLED